MNPKIGRTIGRFGLALRKHLPTITTVASSIGVIGTAVFSARAAYKSVPAIEEHKDILEQLRANKDGFDTEKEYNKEVVSVYKKTGVELLKSYWPAAVSSGLTIAGIFSTNSIHRKRYFAMAGMYTAVNAAYNEYRKRVSEKYGEDAERDLYLGLKREEIVTIETDKKGKEKTKTEVVVTPESTENPNYDVWLIDPSCKFWYKNHPEQTYYYLKHTVEADMTQLLRTRGYVFLNEVFRALELPEVPAGQYIGWIYDENKSETDNAIDFGLYEGTENFDFFISGKNEFVYIRFNHDGTILDKFEDYDRLHHRKRTKYIPMKGRS